MDVLKDKQTKNYDYISRYSGLYFYYNTLDDKYIYGLGNQMKTDVQCIVHYVEPNDDLDYLANKYYGRPDFFWIIADFNRIRDPFVKLSDHYVTLKIPSISDIGYKE